MASNEVEGAVMVAETRERSGRSSSTILVEPAPQVRHLSAVIAHTPWAADLEQVEERLLARAASQSPLITAAGRHTIQSGGKRVRALLALLAASLGRYEFPRVLNAAAAAELIHAASLVHDDLVDNAIQRRGQITVHARWGNDVALMVGDYFFALAAHEMALAPDPRVIAVYAQAVRTIVEGELSPVRAVEPLETALAQYFFKTGSKTAALFEAACTAGMICGGGDEAQIAALGRFGYDLGMAFQIVDDILDFTGDERSLGKPAGNDVRQGTITLPLIYAVANGGKALTAVLELPEPDDAQIAQTITDVQRWRGIADAQTTAERYARTALAQIEPFAGTHTHRVLTEITQFVVDRSS